jgi:hypothetical protein
MTPTPMMHFKSLYIPDGDSGKVKNMAFKGQMAPCVENEIVFTVKCMYVINVA